MQRYVTYLLIDDYIDFDPLVSFSFQESIESPLGVAGWWPTEIQFWAQPPVQDHDHLKG